MPLNLGINLGKKLNPLGNLQSNAKVTSPVAPTSTGLDYLENLKRTGKDIQSKIDQHVASQTPSQLPVFDINPAQSTVNAFKQGLPVSKPTGGGMMPPTPSSETLAPTPKTEQPIQTRETSFMDNIIPKASAQAELSDSEIQTLIQEGYSDEEISKANEDLKNVPEQIKPVIAEAPKEEQGFLGKLGEAYAKPIQTLGEELVKKPVDRFLDYVQGRDLDPANTYSGNDIWKTAGAGVSAGFNALLPGVTAGFNIAGSTETGGKVLSSMPGQIGVGATLGGATGGKKGAILGGAIGTIPGATDFILNNTPGLKDYYNSLSEEGKSGMQGTISGLTMVGAGGVAAKYQGKTPKQLAEELNKLPQETAHGIVDAIKTMPENIKNSLEKAALGDKAVSVDVPTGKVTEIKPSTTIPIDKSVTKAYESYKKAISPSVNETNTPQKAKSHQKSVETTGRDIIKNKESLTYTDKDGNIVDSGRTPETINEHSQAISQRGEAIYDEYRNLEKETGLETPVTYEPVIKNLQILKEKIKTNPELQELIPYITQKIKTYSELTGNLDSVIEGKKTLNQKLKSLFKNQNYSDIGKDTVDLIANKSLGEILDSKIGDSAYGDLKTKWGANKQLQKETFHRDNVTSRQKEFGFFDLSNPLSAMEMIDTLVTGNPAGAIKAAGIQGVKWYMKLRNSPNTQIKEFYKNLEGANREGIIQKALRIKNESVNLPIEKSIYEGVDTKPTPITGPNINLQEEIAKAKNPLGGLKYKAGETPKVNENALLDKLTQKQRESFNKGTPAEQKNALEHLKLKYSLESNDAIVGKPSILNMSQNKGDLISPAINSSDISIIKGEIEKEFKKTMGLNTVKSKEDFIREAGIDYRLSMRDKGNLFKLGQKYKELGGEDIDFGKLYEKFTKVNPLDFSQKKKGSINK